MKKISILLLTCLLLTSTSLDAKKSKKRKKTKKVKTAQKQQKEQPPKNLVAKPAEEQVTLSWAPAVLVDSTLTGYNIYRSTTSGTYDEKPIATVDSSTVTYTDTSLQNGIEYFYVVNAGLKVLPLFLNSEDTNEASATPYKKPPRPKNIIAAPKGKHIIVSWEAPETNKDTIITNYEIYRTTKSKKYGIKPIATVDNTTCTYVDHKITKEVPYFYVIKTVCTNIKSNPSSEVMAMVEKEVIIPDPEKNPPNLYRENAKASKPRRHHLRNSKRNTQNIRQSWGRNSTQRMYGRHNSRRSSRPSSSSG